MQTFLPFADIERSARSLDNKRLGKQRVEVLQLLHIALRASIQSDGGAIWFEPTVAPSPGWRRHPAFLMWQAHPWALAQYGLAICAAWQQRGFADTIGRRLAFAAANAPFCAQTAHRWPHWIGDDAFHYSHRANLSRKDPRHYLPLFPDVDIVTAPVWPYVWPTTTLPQEPLV